jgi:two-component system sensor histidine kinase NreB
MIELQTALFTALESAVWLLDAQEAIVAKSHGAQKIEQEYQMDVARILNVSRGTSCARHPEAFICPECSLNQQISPLGFPFVLRRNDDTEVEFWGQINKKDNQMLLQITLKEQSNDENHSMFGYLNDARELERKKIAQDLHDGVAQSIYSLMLETRALKWLSDEQHADHMKIIEQHFAEILSEVKAIAGELRPMALDEFGLLPALEQFIERTNQMTGFEIEMTILGQQQAISESVRVAVYRMIQEAVANAMKYSGTNLVEVELIFNDRLQVEIRDEGVGFDSTTNKLGFGLLNMKERAAAVSGEFYIKSKPNQGTTLTIIVPLKQK